MTANHKVLQIEKKARSILDEVRHAIKDASNGDPDAWFKINRWVHARLNLDERKPKLAIKKALFSQSNKCSYCHGPLQSLKNIHLDRLNDEKGYSFKNCVLAHPDCHQKKTRAATLFASRRKATERSLGQRGTLRGEVVKRIKSAQRAKLVRWSLQQTIEVCETVDDDFRRIGLNPAKVFRAHRKRGDRQSVKRWVRGCRFPWFGGPLGNSS